MVPPSDLAATPTLFDMAEETKSPSAKKASSRSKRAPKAERKPAQEPEKPASEAPTKAPRGSESGSRRATAEEMGSRQRDISVAEFFTKIPHLLEFDSPLP